MKKLRKYRENCKTWVFLWYYRLKNCILIKKRRLIKIDVSGMALWKFQTVTSNFDLDRCADILQQK